MNDGKIIVVDDEDNIRQAVEGILTDEGYDVQTAGGGEEALRMIQAETPDLVLLDIWIPGIDGIQTLKILKNIDPDVEVVMMTGHGTIDTAVKATKFGAFDFIEKPFSMEYLLGTVAKALKARKARLAAAPATQENGRVQRRFIGASREAEECRRMIIEASENDRPVILTGEMGLGKKYSARLIHSMSERRAHPFLEITCDTMTHKVFDTTFMQRHPDRPSRFEISDGGTLFFNRIDRLSPSLLAKLLGVLKKGRFTPRGAKEEAPFDVRVIVSMGPVEESGDILDLLHDGLDALVIPFTPLRERKKDIPEYIEHFIEELSAAKSKDVEGVDQRGSRILASLPLEGNLTELKARLTRAVEVCDGTVIRRRHIESFDEENEAGRYGFTDRRRAAGQGDKKLARGDGKRKTGRRQRTLKNSVVLCGHGLHSGIKTGLILSPLPPNSGIIFGEISSGARVSANLDYVKSTDYATTLSDGHVTIKTVEHIMSALSSYGITNLLIKIGDEAPIMDGSALDFCDLIEDSGVVEQEERIDEIIIEEPLQVGDPDQGPGIRVEPARHFSVTYYLEYPPPIGAQRYDYVYRSGAQYKEEIAPARTFGFLKDIKALNEIGLASGGKLNNVVLIDDEKIVNTPLRFSDEPARHKILDLIGDLYLLGQPVRGRFIARKSGHTQNIALIKEISRRYLEKTGDAARATR